MAGVKVVELAHIMAGPVCGLMLADLGAAVTKVEKLDGDDARRFVPPTLQGESAAFMMLNRNKRGIAVDLKQAAGREVVLSLLKGADVVIENYRKGTMERLGLGYDALAAVNPGLVYCEVSGFGRTGPLGEQGGFDLIAQGMSGLMSITGEGGDRPPVKCGPPITDITAGILAAMGVCAALHHRHHTGRGQRVDTSLFEAGIVQTYWQSAIALATGQSPGALGSAHPLNAPYQAFATRDGWITVGAANQANWLKLLKALGAEALQEQPRFASNAARMAHLDELVAELSPHFAAHTTAEWLECFAAMGFPAGPILDVGEMHRHPQTLARRMVCEVPHRRLGTTETLGPPVKFSTTPLAVTRGAPLLGEHTWEILTEGGYSAAAIQGLVDAKAVVVADLTATTTGG